MRAACLGWVAVIAGLASCVARPGTRPPQRAGISPTVDLRLVRAALLPDSRDVCLKGHIADWGGSSDYRSPDAGASPASSEHSDDTTVDGDVAARGLAGDAGTSYRRGSLDREEIRAVIRQHTSEVRACYEARLARLLALRGRVVVNFVIGSDGTVVGSFIRHTTMHDRTLEICVGRLVCRWQFPKPLGGGIVNVTYPYNFTPQ
jgi:hypothetical protein